MTSPMPRSAQMTFEPSTSSVGIVGWRGMVGSVLLQRMLTEGDFAHFSPVFFSTSSAGHPAPQLDGVEPGHPSLMDAFDIETLAKLPIIVTAQGGDYTSEVYPKLRSAGWDGLWIDAASTLRTESSSLIALDPINRDQIDAALGSGIKEFVGGNCTVSCMLMGLGGLFRAGLVEWGTASTYQAASGGGAQHMRELLTQFGGLHEAVGADLHDPASAILEIDQKVLNTQRGGVDTSAFGTVLAGSLIPWIDSDLGNGVAKEEWKGSVETNKLLGRGDHLTTGLTSQGPKIPFESTCVRIGAMRSHSQSIVLKLREELPLSEVESLIAGTSPWTQVVPNEKTATVEQLTPVAATGGLDVPVGRIRALEMGPEYIGAFTIGDQLLWGAAEPLRRMLLIALGKL